MWLWPAHCSGPAGPGLSPLLPWTAATGVHKGVRASSPRSCPAYVHGQPGKGMAVHRSIEGWMVKLEGLWESPTPTCNCCDLAF